MLASKRSIGPHCARSRALPCATPTRSGMSTSTMSPSSLAAAQWAQVAPTFPAPMIEILARRTAVFSVGRWWFEGRASPGTRAPRRAPAVEEGKDDRHTRAAERAADAGTADDRPRQKQRGARKGRRALGVGQKGLEPSTSPLSGACSSQLSY